MVPTSSPAQWYVLPRSLIQYCTKRRTVTPGNRGAAVVAGLNVIVFTIIALLAHREKIQKKRNNQFTSDSPVLEHSEASLSDAHEKGSPVINEKDVTPTIKY